MKKSFRRIFTFFLALTMLSSSLVFTFPAQAKSEGLSLMRQTVIEEMKNMSMVKWKAGKTYTTYHVYYYNGGGGEKMTWNWEVSSTEYYEQQVVFVIRDGEKTLYTSAPENISFGINSYTLPDNIQERYEGKEIILYVEKI